MPQYLFFVLTNVASKATCTHSPKSTHDCIKPCNIQSKTPNGRVTGLLQSTPTITPSPLFAGDSPYSTTIPNRSPQTPSTECHVAALTALAHIATTIEAGNSKSRAGACKTGRFGPRPHGWAYAGPKRNFEIPLPPSPIPPVLTDS